MSPSRRSTGNIHILAMLDGAVTRSRPRRVLLWSGVAGALACGLAATAVWWMHAPTPATNGAVATADMPPSAPAAIADTYVPAVAPLTTTGGATIVNVPEAPVPHLAPVIAGLPAPAPSAVAPAQRPAPSLHASLRTLLPKHAAPRPAPAPHPAVATAHAAAAHAAVPHAPAPRRAPPPAKATPPSALDTDVALITAIIQHGANKREAATDGGCSGNACAERQTPPP